MLDRGLLCCGRHTEHAIVDGVDAEARLLLIWNRFEDLDDFALCVGLRSVRIIVVLQLVPCMLLHVVKRVLHSVVPLIGSSCELRHGSDIVHNRSLVKIKRACEKLVVAPEHEALCNVFVMSCGEDFVDEVRVLEISNRISHLDYIRIAQPWKFRLCVDPYVADVLCVFLYGSEGDSEFEIVRVRLCAEWNDDVCHASSFHVLLLYL